MMLTVSVVYSSQRQAEPKEKEKKKKKKGLTLKLIFVTAKNQQTAICTELEEEFQWIRGGFFSPFLLRSGSVVSFIHISVSLARDGQ